MYAIPQNRVVLWLAFFLAPILGAAELGPLAVGIQIPESLRRRPIWCVARLPQGELAVGFEGGVAVGFPGGSWRQWPAPNGQSVQAVAAGHGRRLVAGAGFCALLEGAHLAPVAGMSGEYECAEVVPEGWLVAGSDGVWLVSPAGTGTRLAGKRVSGNRARLCRIGGRLVVSLVGMEPRIWQKGKLAEDSSLAAFAADHIHSADGGLVLSYQGISDHQGTRMLAVSTKDAMIDEGGIVGIAESGPLVLLATFGGGLSAYHRATGKKLWTWRAAGNIYCLVRDGDGLLLGTESGVFSVANPAAVQLSGLGSGAIIEVMTGADSGVDVITDSGAIHVSGSEAQVLPDAWPNRGGAFVRDAILHFGDSAIDLVAPVVTGVSVMHETVAAADGQKLILLTRSGGSIWSRLEGVLGAVATDGRNFLVATTTRGVHVVTAEGNSDGRIGDGRANVSEVRPGKVALLFWDGTVLDSDSSLLGRVPSGNPRDAALVDGRLAVLVTRTDREPVIGLLSKEEWQPLDIPGLAEIGAEQVGATDTHLFVAGPRGVLGIRLPLAPAVAPRAAWRWSVPVVNGEVTLAESAQDTASVSFIPGELGPAPATSLRLRAGDGAWTELAPGNSLQLAVAAGRTRVVLQAERNGLVTESVVTVFRPHPWWQRVWAWPLHLAFLVGLVVGFARWRTRRLERRTRELEARVAERTGELRKANAVKEEFLASISHEIRNPLNGVVGICEMLAERNVGPKEQMLVRTLGGCADQLRSMLDDILDFSQLERKTPTLSNADFELVSLVEECARVMDPDLVACSLILPEQACWLHGDSGKLRQVLCNLISNALKYGVPREAGVEVQLTAVEGGRIRARLAVRNTGETIPPDEIPLLFESFRRGHQTAGAPGSGLGLAVCRRLAVAMGGHLTAASAGGMTEFAFEVVLPSAQPPLPKESAPAAVSRALAIEDEDYNRMVLGHVLRALGYSVDWAENAADALRLAASRPYDLVLTDWRLPDMEGGELCVRLLALMPAPQPPIIAVTAYANAEKLAEAKKVGMAGFITKPVTREKLERVIRGMSNSRQPRRSLDTETIAPHAAPSPLASLGALAPSPQRLASEITEMWRTVSALAGLQDPRTGREAHALRSLLLMAGEASVAEQLGLLEEAAKSGDWDAVQRLLPHVSEEIASSDSRLRA